MSYILLIILFVTGYVLIALEHGVKINKAGTALVMGILCWTAYSVQVEDKAVVLGELMHHLGDISSILFFLMGAMAIVELVDSHHGFDIITASIKSTTYGNFLILIGTITFFLSAVLDNLTTTIVMLSLASKIIDAQEDKWRFAGIIVIAANAGGTWSPLGDVTTTMLWIGGQITALHTIAHLILPSLLCCAAPMLLMWRLYKNKPLSIPPVSKDEEVSDNEKRIVFFLGLAGLVMVPVFKTLTHLPPFMGMMLSLGFIWVITNIIHRNKEYDLRRTLSVTSALQKIDMPSVLFFLGILLSVSALQAAGALNAASVFIRAHLHSDSGLGILLGLLSAVIDNVPLVAAAQGMFDLQHYPSDHFFWTLLTFTTGTGGSAVIIGSAAGVAAMGIEKISFFWYLRKITYLALIGFFAGVATYLLTSQLFQ